jgi:hypothetical protein
MTDGYSKAVYDSLRARGIAQEEIRRATAISQITLHAIAHGKREFTNRQLAKIEQLAGSTAGQLAAEALGAADQALLAVFDAWSEASKAGNRTGSSRRTNPSAKPAARPQRRSA